MMKRFNDFEAKELLTIFSLVIILSFVIFGNGIGGDFVFDDRSVIVGNPMVENISGAVEAFISPYYYARPQSGLYRPLTLASYTLDWHLFSGNPQGFHVVNILLHAIASFLVYLVLKGSGTFFGTKKAPNPFSKVAAVGSLLFLFLPIHVEAVTSIVGRGELLMFLFFLASFLSIQKSYYKTAATFFFLSLLSKETAIAFIPVFLFFEFAWRKMPLKELFAKTFYFIPPLIIYALLRYNALGSQYFMNNNAYTFFNPILAMDFFPGLWTAFKVLYLYVQKIIFPTYLSSDYSYNQIVAVNNLFDSWQALAGVGIFTTIIYLFVSKRNSLVGLGAAIFLFSYLVVSNFFIKIGTIMAERLMYMPSLGLAMLAATVISDQWSVVSNKIIKGLIYVGLVVILTWYGYLIIDRNKDWLNEKNLFESAYAVAPNSVVNITNMASILFREGKNEKALEKIETALNIEPKNSPALHLAGQIHKSAGDDKTAEEYWRKAIEAQPDYLYPYLSLGALYYRRGDFKSGEEILFRAGEIYDTPNVVSLLSLNKIGLEKYSESVNLVEEKFGSKPREYELRFILGVAYLKSGNEPKARELLLELKDPALTEEDFFLNLREIKIFNIEI